MEIRSYRKDDEWIKSTEDVRGLKHVFDGPYTATSLR
jgi:hypothetical protein